MIDKDDQHRLTPKGPTVLIADDHPKMRAALARLVRTECDVVGTVADGDILVTEARRLRPDVVISDLFMPTLDGFAAGRLIKRELPATRLIYVTGHADPDFVAEALQIGAFALVPKMSAGSELSAVIRRAMVEPIASRKGYPAGPDTITRATLPPSADPYQILLREFSSLQPDDTAGFADLPSLRMRLNLLRIPALAADGTGRYVAVNDAAAALTGLAVHELEAMTVWDLTPVPQSEAGARLWSEFVTVGEQWGTYTLTAKHGLPTHVYYYARAHVLPNVHLSLLLPRR